MKTTRPQVTKISVAHFGIHPQTRPILESAKSASNDLDRTFLAKDIRRSRFL